MARFYFHLRGTEESLDEEGREFPDMEALRKAVLEGARDVMGNDIKSYGVLDLRYRIDAAKAGGQIVHSLRFKHALNIIADAE